MNAVEAGWKRVESDGPRVAFSIPDDWIAVELTPGIISAISPELDEEHYRAHVAISETPLAGLGDLETFGDRHLHDLRRTLTDFQLIEVSDAQLGAFRLPGVRITGSFRQGTYDLTYDEWLGLSDTMLVKA